MLLMISAWPLGAEPAGSSTYYFSESYGPEAWVSAYHLENLGTDSVRLSFANRMESQVILIDQSDYSTLDWECTLPGGRGAASATLKAQVLVIQGKLDGRPFEFRQPTDGAPWYQAADYQLTRLLGPERGGAQKFWVINSQDFRPYLLSAQNLGTESITFGGGTRKAVRIVVGVPGLPLIFWRNDFWYDPETQDYLMFRGRRGAPWTPLISLDFLYKE